MSIEHDGVLLQAVVMVVFAVLSMMVMVTRSKIVFALVYHDGYV